MKTCETCQDTGNCPCGASDCGPKPCPDCWCDSCAEAGQEIISKLGGKNICKDCYADEIMARAEDAWDDRPERGQI